MKPLAQLMPVGRVEKNSGDSTMAAISLYPESIRDLESLSREGLSSGVVNSAPS
jgi:hypothetical protein